MAIFVPGRGAVLPFWRGEQIQSEARGCGDKGGAKALQKRARRRERKGDRPGLGAEAIRRQAGSAERQKNGRARERVRLEKRGRGGQKGTRGEWTRGQTDERAGGEIEQRIQGAGRARAGKAKRSPADTGRNGSSRQREGRGAEKKMTRGPRRQMGEGGEKSRRSREGESRCWREYLEG